MRKIEFDIEKVKEGAKLVTRNGEPVRIICLDRHRSCYPIVALVGGKEGERIEIYTSEGKHRADGEYSSSDLFILEEPTVRPYVNADEFLKDIQKHGLMLKNILYDSTYTLVVEFSNKGVTVGHKHYSFSQLQDFFTWQDGSPCGVCEDNTDE